MLQRQTAGFSRPQQHQSNLLPQPIPAAAAWRRRRGVAAALPPSPHNRKQQHVVRRVVAAAAAAAADMPHHHHSQQHAGGLPAAAWQQVTQLVAPSPYDRELFALAVPALAAMLLEPLMNVISAAVLGHLGTQQLGAVSLASLATSLATYMFSFLVFLTTPRIAAAHAHGDTKRVSRLAAVGLWLAFGTGTAVAIGMHAGADLIVQALKPREAEVATYAVSYIRVRAFGIVAALLGFVASGSYRGIKDTATPLKAALGAAATHLVLTPLFILGLDWGVFGAGLAATLSTWVSCAILLVSMFQRGVVSSADLATLPRKHEVVPYLKKGAVLAFRMVVTFGMVMFASAICVRAGAVSQAAFEIIRQAWIISIQLFEALNVAMQAMAAGFLGRGNRVCARAVLVRALQLSTAIGVCLGLGLAAANHQLVGLFTSDTAVAALASAIIPIIAVCMPLDAAASITDGGLIAAGQTNALSVMQVVGTLVQYALMAALLRAGMGSVVHVWAVLKVLTVARLSGGLWLHFASARSAYRSRTPKAAAPPAAPAAAPPAAQGSRQDGADGASTSSSSGEVRSSIVAFNLPVQHHPPHSQQQAHPQHAGSAAPAQQQAHTHASEQHADLVVPAAAVVAAATLQQQHTHAPEPQAVHADLGPAAVATSAEHVQQRL